jgi:hypothetical protein
MTNSNTTADPTALRLALAELRSRLDQQQALILDGFASLRQEIDALDEQVRQLASGGSLGAEAASESADDPEVTFTAEEDEAALAAAAGISPPGDENPAIPVGKVASAPQDDAPATGEVNAGDPEPTVDEPTKQPEFKSQVPARPTEQQPYAVVTSTSEPSVNQLPQGEEINMENVMFGLDLAANQTLSPERQTLLQGLYAGDGEAMTLLGQILIFRGASPDRMPSLLKELGEAFYRWRPDTAAAQDGFRDELIGWLQRSCDHAGVPNTIELVQPGDRYDSKRHHSKDRGIEVDQVQGWVVLRDNGKVYTKASVTLK